MNNDTHFQWAPYFMEDGMKSIATAISQEPPRREEQEEENFLVLWSYLRRRYPEATLESKSLMDLIQMKNQLEGPKVLRPLNQSEIAMVIKR